jgi:hypothetical protein
MGSAALLRPAHALVAPALRLPFPWLVFLVAVGIRFVSFLVFYLGSIALGHHGQVDPYDSVGIDRWGWLVAQSLHHGQLVNLSRQDLAGQWNILFYYLVGLQYFFVGDYPEVPRIVNLVLASLPVPAVYFAASHTVLGEAVARRAAWLAALWPLSLYWSGYDLLKDPLVWAFLALVLVAIVERRPARFAILGAVIFVGETLTRLYIGTAMFLFLPFAALVRRDIRALAGVVTALVIAEAALLSAGWPAAWSILPYQGNGIPYINRLLPEHGSLRSTISSITGDTSGTSTAGVEGSGSNAAASATQGGAKGATARLTFGLFVTVLGPRPTLREIFHPTLDTGTYPGLAVWLVLIPFTVLGLWRGLRTGDPRVLLIGLLAISLWVGLAYFFAGGAFRQREMAFPSTLVFTALGLQRPWPHRWWWAYGGVLTLGALALGLRETGII